MANGLSRLATRFWGDPDRLDAARALFGQDLPAGDCLESGLVTFAPDDIDWDDEVRLMLEERAAFSPDALTGMEASLRFRGTGDHRDQDLRPALGLAELDLPAPQCHGRRRGPASLWNRAPGRCTTGAESEEVEPGRKN